MADRKRAGFEFIPVRSCLEQPDGRIRFWGEIVQPGEHETRFLRVITLADGETIHNAFFDRRFRKDD